jgi:hypothetical protein
VGAVGHEKGFYNTNNFPYIAEMKGWIVDAVAA